MTTVWVQVSLGPEYVQNIFSRRSLKKTCLQRKLRQTKWLLLNFWMITLTKTPILPNFQNWQVNILFVSVFSGDRFFWGNDERKYFTHILGLTHFYFKKWKIKLKDDKGSFINIFKNLRHFHNQSRTNDEFQNSCFANCGEMNPWFLLLNYLKYGITFDQIVTFRWQN